MGGADYARVRDVIISGATRSLLLWKRPNMGNVSLVFRAVARYIVDMKDP